MIKSFSKQWKLARCFTTTTTTTTAQAPIKTNYNPKGEKQTKHHGHYRFDSYNDIRHDKKWQARIIKREDENFEKWVELVAFHYEQWRKSVFGRSDPEIESIPEKYGDYIYFLRHKEHSHKIPGT
jgi:protease II